MTRSNASVFSIYVLLVTAMCLVNCPLAWAIGTSGEFNALVQTDRPTTLSEWRDLAEEGDIEAQEFMGRAYFSGEGVPKDQNLGAEWFRKAAELGAVKAQYMLGMLYQEGVGVPKDFAESVRWYRRAAEQGFAVAQLKVSLAYFKGRGVTRDLKKTVEWLHRAAAQGLAGAQYALGRLHFAGVGVPESTEEAVKWLRLAAEQGDDDAQLLLGEILVVKEHKEAAVSWFRKAAEQGNAKAQYHLGWAYHKGKGVAENPKKAAKWLRLASEQGHAEAQFVLGFLLATGRGVTKSFEHAVQLYKRAAEQGHTYSQYLLASMFRTGAGVPKDLKAAARWFQRAAEQGFNDARLELGSMYRTGEGVHQNHNKALELYLHAAEEGNWQAQNDVALLYVEGMGVTYNPEKALFWMRKSAINEQKEKPCHGVPASILGDWYLTGKHAPVIRADNQKALYWLWSAAKADHAHALSNLALMYATGTGVPQDYKEMVRLLIKSASAFGKLDQWYLNEGDDWPKFTRADVPGHFMQVRNLYWKAISTREVKYLVALRKLSEDDEIAPDVPHDRKLKSAAFSGVPGAFDRRSTSMVKPPRSGGSSSPVSLASLLDRDPIQLHWKNDFVRPAK